MTLQKYIENTIYCSCEQQQRLTVTGNKDTNTYLSEIEISWPNIDVIVIEVFDIFQVIGSCVKRM